MAFTLPNLPYSKDALAPHISANTLSFVISRRYQPTPIYHSLLQQDQINLPSTARRIE